MISEKVGDFALITQSKDLLGMVESLRREQILAVDTESNSLYAYRERVCLIQFSTMQEADRACDYLVDPLALEDLSPLAILFNDPGIVKVFHAAEYDLLCLRRDFDLQVCNLFDTMIAARILGRDEFGLGSMLESEFGVKLDKRYQRANWGQRPLPEHLLDYARWDTHYLIALHDRLQAELAERGLSSLAQEDFRRMENARRTGAGNDNGNGPPPGAEKPVDCWRISGSYDLAPQQAATLLELCRYRDEQARKQDRPLFKVINDQTLLAIASETPNSLEQLGRLPGMSAHQVRRHGRQLLECVRRGLQAEPIYPPRSKRPDERFSERLDALRNWRKNLATEIGVSSDVILPRDLMFCLAEKGPRDAAELAEALQAAPWRLEHFGDQILEALIKG